MEEPVIAAKKPIQMTLEPGTYYWCACGRAKKQPLCDGSHKGTAFKPLAFEVTEKKDFWLCACKQTKTKPNCDGTHKSLA